MKYCVKCGSQNTDTAKFCTECGAALAISEANDNINFTYETVENEEPHTNETTVLDTTYSYGENKSSNDADASEDKYTYTYTANNSNYSGGDPVHTNISSRNIVVAIILSIVTCGIYQLYWMFKMNNEVNELSGNQDAPSGGLVILFDIITCGIYGIYWSYKMGERCDDMKCSVNKSSHILYLILTLLGLEIVTFCLIQDSINKTV